MPSVVFRADSSREIGTGHVMRCLALAEVLRSHQIACAFVCRELPGNIIDRVADAGFEVCLLPSPGTVAPSDEAVSGYGHWLGVTQATDARDTRAALAGIDPDWLVVDHYALDACWERALRPHCRKLMAIDDLADRVHDCDALLDQTLGRVVDDYAGLVPEGCRMLLGAHHALVRPEFRKAREGRSRASGVPVVLRRILVAMGGVDPGNATGQVLDALADCALPADCLITVVLGKPAPWRDQVALQAGSLPFRCEVLTDVRDMAQLMSGCDLAIGAAGSSAWERCVLGIPSIVVVLADNQRRVASALSAAGAALVINGAASIGARLPAMLEQATRLDLGDAAWAVCDGYGLLRTATAMESVHCTVRGVEPRDLARIREWRNHPDIRRYMYTRHEISPDEHERWYAACMSDSRRHLLLVEEAGNALGFVQFTQVTPKGAEWGFYAAPDARSGSGLRMAFAALDHAFHRLGVRTVHGEAVDFNAKSNRLHDKIGFRREKTLPGRFFDGERHHDVHRYLLTASDWPCLKRRDP